MSAIAKEKLNGLHKLKRVDGLAPPPRNGWNQQQMAFIFKYVVDTMPRQDNRVLPMFFIHSLVFDGFHCLFVVIVYVSMANGINMHIAFHLFAHY